MNIILLLFLWLTSALLCAGMSIVGVDIASFLLFHDPPVDRWDIYKSFFYLLIVLILTLILFVFSRRVNRAWYSVLIPSVSATIIAAMVAIYPYLFQLLGHALGGMLISNSIIVVLVIASKYFNNWLLKSTQLQKEGK